MHGLAQPSPELQFALAEVDIIVRAYPDEGLRMANGKVGLPYPPPTGDRIYSALGALLGIVCLGAPCLVACLFAIANGISFGGIFIVGFAMAMMYSMMRFLEGYHTFDIDMAARTITVHRVGGVFAFGCTRRTIPLAAISDACLKPYLRAGRRNSNERRARSTAYFRLYVTVAQEEFFLYEFGYDVPQLAWSGVVLRLIQTLIGQPG